MKFKTDFVTNSSSTAFIITNISDIKKTLVDFVFENPQLLEEYNKEYDFASDPNITNINQTHLLKSAMENNIEFAAGESKECVFGDEDGTLIGRIFDYILRDGGNSKSFVWKYHDSYR